MKAPDKIYIKPLLMEDGESVVRRCTFQKQSNSQIEYLRTDVFIKRIEDFLYDQLLLGNIECGNITKLIENFKKQIKTTKLCISKKTF